LGSRPNFILGELFSWTRSSRREVVLIRKSYFSLPLSLSPDSGGEGGARGIFKETFMERLRQASTLCFSYGS
jgi:hypothetical protein